MMTDRDGWRESSTESVLLAYLHDDDDEDVIYNFKARILLYSFTEMILFLLLLWYILGWQKYIKKMNLSDFIE